MATVLVTGIAGFIGSHVARRLIDNNHEVIGIDDLSGGFMANVPDGCCFYKGNICNAELVDSIFQHHSPDYVYHLAAYAAEGLSHFIRTYNYQNNLIGSCVLINAAVKHEVKGFVFTSSMAVYGDQVPPFTEDLPLKPIDPYGVAKSGVEQDLKAANEVFGLKYVIIRPYNIYGPYQNIGDFFRNVIGIQMNQCLKGIPMSIFGDGEQRRCFSYIDEITPAIASVIDRSDCWGQTFNMGGTKNYSINELSLKISQVMGVPHLVEYLPKRHEATMAWCSPEKAYQWFANKMSPVSLDDGLSKMAEWAIKRGPQKCKPFTHVEILKNLHSRWLPMVNS